MPRKPTYRWATSAAVIACAAVVALSWDRPHPPPIPARLNVASDPSVQLEDIPLTPGRALQAPSDTPARLTCWQAGVVAMQARDLLAQPPPALDVRTFADSTLDWLDPHGLWSAPKQAPIRAALQQYAAALLASLEHPGNDLGCSASLQLGSILQAWTSSLRDVYDQQLALALRAPADRKLGWAAASEPVFENGPVLRPADALAADLGHRTGTFLAASGKLASFVPSQARHRMFPNLDPTAWAEVILAAAVRSYVLLIDPHGAWAPFDEETSLYEVELEATGRHRLWSRMSRTAVGVRVDEDPVPPLHQGDVVLMIDDIATAGLSVEQVEQLAVLDPADAAPDRAVTLLRGASSAAKTLRVSARPAVEPDENALVSLEAQRIAYRDGEVLVLRIEDVPDDLGEQLAQALAAARRKGRVTGLLLDLRGNGGGSIDGAKAAISLFLPGAPLFPMRRRDGEVEVEVAPVSPPADRWKGPVAVLVDAETASAAEMIAGALTAYERAVVVGTRTFGKGCAQEYMDDDAGVGVLRLSTLVYALPDGSPVQRNGLMPQLPIDLGPTTEREDALPHAMRAWRGPDVRRRTLVAPVPWPSHAGRFGKCNEEVVCRALRALGMPRTASVRAATR